MQVCTVTMFGPVRPRRVDRRAQEPAADPLPHRMLHHAEIGEVDALRQMRLEVEQAGRRAVEIEHADVAAGHAQAVGQLLVGRAAAR